MPERPDSAIREKDRATSKKMIMDLFRLFILDSIPYHNRHGKDSAERLDGNRSFPV
jgi:hypothetical protein